MVVVNGQPTARCVRILDPADRAGATLLGQKGVDPICTQTVASAWSACLLRGHGHTTPPVTLASSSPSMVGFLAIHTANFASALKASNMSALAGTRW